MFSRALGHLYTPVAALLWVVTILATLIALTPMAFTTAVPYYGGTVHDFFHDFAFPFAMALVIANGLSGRWGPETMRGWDKTSTRIGFWGTILICFMLVGLLNFYPGYHVEKFDMWFLGGLLLFSWYDKSVNQGENWRSSVLRNQTPPVPAKVAAREKPIATPAATTGAQGPYMSFVPELGGETVSVDGRFTITLLPTGWITVSTPMNKAQVMAVLEGELQRRAKLVAPVVVAPDAPPQT